MRVEKKTSAYRVPIGDYNYLQCCCCQLLHDLKVRQSQNDFFKPTFLPKNE